MNSADSLAYFSTKMAENDHYFGNFGRFLGKNKQF